MQIIKENFFQNLKSIIQERARFQKVFLLYDDSVPSFEISKLYYEIKGDCVFNQANLLDFDANELNNGYRLIIFFCSAASFLKKNFSCEDYVKIFIPTSNQILPFFVSEKNQLVEDGYVFLKNNAIDVGILFSVYFNKFFNYLNDVCLNRESAISFDFDLKNINQHSLLNLLNDNLFFADFRILKKMNISIELLPIVDYLLLTAFKLLICAIKEKSATMVDIYKAFKEDYSSIDRFYMLMFNDVFFETIKYNFISLKNLLDLTIEKLSPIINMLEISGDDICEVQDKLREFCKEEAGIFGYLYLFNIFGR